MIGKEILKKLVHAGYVAGRSGIPEEYVLEMAENTC